MAKASSAAEASAAVVIEKVVDDVEEKDQKAKKGEHRVRVNSWTEINYYIIDRSLLTNLSFAQKRSYRHPVF